ncbi:MAG: hypothetical protein AB7F86_00235 [Bdellovibrionales bacterium]
MFYFALLLFSVQHMLLPWWTTAVLAVLLGFFTDMDWWRAITTSFAAGLSAVIAAYYFDARSGSLISHRLAGLFGAHSVTSVFLGVLLLSSVTAFLWLGFGDWLSRRVGAS